jgi:hypothetical protein
MIVKEGKITISITGTKFLACTERFVGLLANILDKGIDNPAYQLHILFMMTTGKPLVEFLDGEEDIIQIVELIKILSGGILSTITDVRKVELSGSTIEDFLRQAKENNDQE